jgi:hypothetical protein
LPPRRFAGKTKIMSATNNDLLRAIELALAGEWDAAHQIVQQYEDNATASWIHAVLHKIEGDDANSRYWYRRAGRMEHVADEPRAELFAIRAELTTDEHP